MLKGMSIVQGADSAKSQVLPVGVPCIVQASLGSVASSDILLHSLCLERSSSSDGPDSGLPQPQLSPVLRPWTSAAPGLARTHFQPAVMLIPLCQDAMHHARGFFHHWCLMQGTHLCSCAFCSLVDAVELCCRCGGAPLQLSGTTGPASGLQEG